MIFAFKIEALGNIYKAHYIINIYRCSLLINQSDLTITEKVRRVGRHQFCHTGRTELFCVLSGTHALMTV